ncbi:hypothetical protein HanPSC8_Chr03g0106001 [Helianthus annuus]|nr:hypothetical protein HanPSC8_Chr03g0106001 [Helianthus annuus]
MAESSSSFRLPSFCRHMNKADEFIMMTLRAHYGVNINVLRMLI